MARDEGVADRALIAVFFSTSGCPGLITKNPNKSGLFADTNLAISHSKFHIVINIPSGHYSCSHAIVISK